MTENTSISIEELDPGKDFTLLREEGIEHISNMAGLTWTDHNAHDPGITILEQICYLITDLGYRLSFDIEDLLTPSAKHVNESGEKDPRCGYEDQFFTAKQILTMNPLTINDYRRLISEVEGVQNVWIETISKTIPSIFWDEDTLTQTFILSDTAKDVPLKGLYRVLLEVSKSFDADTVKEKVRDILDKNRNLCEDFEEIIVLPVEEINVKGNYEFKENIDTKEAVLLVQKAIDNFICPTFSFSSLSELLDQGYEIEDIYNGPVLTKGFLTEDAIDEVQRKEEIRVSDLIHVILDLDFVKNVDDLKITNIENPSDDDWKSWALSLSTGRAYRLKASKLTAEAETAANSGKEYDDLPVPVGRYRNLEDYRSIQYEFPVCYGIGSAGLSKEASAKRRAAAKQLQAYLSFYDQIFSNFFAQLGRAKDLMAVKNRPETVCFAKKISDIPGASNIFQGTYKDDIETLSQETAVAIDVKNRLLDHLLARFGESFPNFAKLMKTSVKDILSYKQDFLANCADIGSLRGAAFNYKGDIWDTDNETWLKNRLCSLLAVDNKNRTSIAGTGKEGMHVVENILLRPIGYTISGYSKDGDDKTVCLSKGGVPEQGAYIEIFEAEGYTGKYEVVSCGSDTFTIEKAFNVEIRRSQRQGFSIESVAESILGGTTCTSTGHGLEEGDIVEIYDSGAYNGTYEIVVDDANNFSVDVTYNSLETNIGSWRVPDKIVNFELSQNSSDRTLCTSYGHGLKTGDTIKILEAKTYNGAYEVTKIDRNHFEIEKSFNSTGTKNGEWKLIYRLTRFETDFVLDTTDCQAPENSLNAGDEIEFYISNEFQGTWEIASASENSFVINKIFEARWKRVHQIEDFAENLTSIQFTDHGLSDGDYVEIYDSETSLGRYEVTVKDDNVFEVEDTFEDSTDENAEFSFRKFNKITAYETEGKKITEFTSENHGLEEGQLVELFIGTALDGMQIEISEITDKDRFKTSDPILVAPERDQITGFEKAGSNIKFRSPRFECETGDELQFVAGTSAKIIYFNVLELLNDCSFTTTDPYNYYQNLLYQFSVFEGPVLDIIGCFSYNNKTVLLSKNHNLQDDESVKYDLGEITKTYQIKNMTQEEFDTFKTTMYIEDSITIADVFTIYQDLDGVDFDFNVQWARTEDIESMRKFGLEFRIGKDYPLIQITGCFCTTSSVVCLSERHGLSEGDIIELYIAGEYKKRYKVALMEEEDLETFKENNCLENDVEVQDVFTINSEFDFDGKWRPVTEAHLRYKDSCYILCKGDVKHNLKVGDSIEIMSSSAYDGDYTVQEIIDEQNFTIASEFKGERVVYWWLNSPIEQLFPVTGGKVCVSPGHDLQIGDIISLFSPEEHEGVYWVNEIADDTEKFAITKLVGRWGLVNEIKSFTTKGTVTICEVESHDLIAGEKIEIFIDGVHQGKCSVGTADGENTFNINKTFDDVQGKTGCWIRPKDITAFTDNTFGGTLCTSENHGLEAGSEIVIISQDDFEGPKDYEGFYTVTGGTKNAFSIDKTFCGKRTYGKNTKDPYSMQLTVVMPSKTDSERFQDTQFRQTVEDYIRNETPAHIKSRVLWFDDDAMADFELKYKNWLTSFASDAEDKEAKADILFERIR